MWICMTWIYGYTWIYIGPIYGYLKLGIVLVHAVIIFLGFCIKFFRLRLGEPSLLTRNIAPFLDNGLLDLPGVGPGPGAHLFGHVHALLVGGILDNSLHFLETLLRALLEAAASRGTEFSGLLGAGSDGGVLLHILLGDVAHLLGPLGAVGGGGVTRGVVLALLLHDGLTFDNVVLDVVNLLLGPTLGLILGPADLRSLDVAVLHKRGTADLSGLVEGDLLVLDEAALPEVLVTVFLLLGFVVCHVGGVTSPVPM